MYPEQIPPLPASPHVRRVLVITTQMRAAPAALAVLGRSVWLRTGTSTSTHALHLNSMSPKITVSTTPNPALTGETNFAITAPFVVYVLALLVLTGHRSPQLVLKARSRNNKLSSRAKARRMCEGRRKNDWTSGEYGPVTECRGIGRKALA